MDLLAPCPVTACYPLPLAKRRTNYSTLYPDTIELLEEIFDELAAGYHYSSYCPIPSACIACQALAYILYVAGDILARYDLAEFFQECVRALFKNARKSWLC